MDIQEAIQRLRVVGAKVHADDGRLELSRVPSFARPLATLVKRQHRAAVQYLLSDVVQVWIDGIEEPLWMATDAETAVRYRRRSARREPATA